MPYIVIKSNGQIVDHRQLTAPVVIGRAPDCDITVRDILLSRRHCRLSPGPHGWLLEDLQSKNGTSVNGERLAQPRALANDDVVRMGKSKIVFHAGAMDEEIAAELMSPARPLDPSDSLSGGTLSGFTLLLPGESEMPENMPCPQPRPKDPAAYDHEELQTLLSAIASSSWDSIYAEARQPMRQRGMPPAEEEGRRRRARPRSPMDLSLQVSAALGGDSAEKEIGGAPAQAAARRLRWKRADGKPRLWPHAGLRRGRRMHALVAGIWVSAAIIAAWNAKLPGQGVFRSPQAAVATDRPSGPRALEPEQLSVNDPAAVTVGDRIVPGNGLSEFGVLDSDQPLSGVESGEKAAEKIGTMRFDARTMKRAAGELPALAPLVLW